MNGSKDSDGTLQSTSFEHHESCASQHGAKHQSRGVTPADSRHSKPGFLIGVLVTAAFVVILNETTLTVALPVLMGEFSIDADQAQWLTTSFMITMAVVIPTTGFVMQRFTLRAIYSFALLTFLAGTIVASFAPSFVVLLFARIVQASGSALVIPLLMTTIMRLVPVERRGSVMGFVSVVIAVAPAVGPTFSGLVLEHLGWRWIFILVVPLVLIALLVGVTQVKNFEKPSRLSLDVLSVLVSAVGFAGTIYGLAGMSQLAEGVPWDRVVILVVALAFLGAFFARQKKMVAANKQPLLNLTPLANREYKLSLCLMLISFSTLFGFIILMPLFGQNVLGLSELQTGLVSLPGGLLMGLAGPFVGKLYDANGIRVLIIPGSLMLLLAMCGFSSLNEQSSVWLLVACTMVLNLGVALMLTPLMSNALAAVPHDLASHGQAILNTFQQVAGGAGTAIFVAVMTFGSASYAKGHVGVNGVEILSHGIHVAFLLGVVISIIALLISVFLRFDVLRDVPKRQAAESAAK
ncbi:DHA2 family efflux MFS transporter permease subunit [Corynebacterium sp. 4HC-13]|uniref:MDR family MFS transporter n=1 Tax=Corynebacterium anserum TaxID=2684406 RepID=UPI00163A1C29|nr:MDR family MFS transporter [Corynebacterium anserum]MBC2682465.1 DHA2 family efflux MFS transporter permease subunit [Corynebacterium anserum]